MKKLPEEGLPTGSVSSAQFGAPQSPGASGEMNKILDALGKAEPSLQFIGEGDRVVLDQAALEMAFSSYSQSMQNPQVYNKWLSIDEKMAKAMRQYKSDIRLLIAGLAQQGQAQAMVADQIPGDASSPAATAAPAPSAPAGQDLPIR